MIISNRTKSNTVITKDIILNTGEFFLFCFVFLNILNTGLKCTPKKLQKKTHFNYKETKIFHIKFYCWHACRDLMKYKNMSFIQICFSSLYNYPVFFFLWHHSNQAAYNIKRSGKFHHVSFYIRFRFSSFSKRCKKGNHSKEKSPNLWKWPKKRRKEIQSQT